MSKIAYLNMPRTRAPVARGMRGFMAWLSDKQPRAYKAVMANLDNGGLGDLGITADSVASDKPASPTWADSIKDIISGVSAAYLTSQQLAAQKKVLDYQLARAKAGQPPANIDLSEYGFTGPSVNVGLTKDTTQTLLIVAAVGVGAFMLMKLVRK